VILLVTPTPVDSPHGNGVSARRWARILRELGYEADLAQDYRPGRYSALLALHARKSASAVRRFRAGHPGAPIMVALTGTDLYPDMRTAGVDPQVLDMAARFIVLQPLGLAQLEPRLRERARVVIQSVPRIARRPPREDCFEVAFLAHVRPVKDPLVVTAATRRLPGASRILVTHLGEARDDELAARLAAESAASQRYEWLGPASREDALGLLARSRLMVLSSRHEGGANVISEALAAGVPIICSKIPGSVGLLGDDYPGYFQAGDAGALARELLAAEEDRGGYYGTLQRRCDELSPLVDPRRERQALATLMSELGLARSLRALTR
jgi:putative glycosyltransferase (TIGR04348 family)